MITLEEIREATVGEVVALGPERFSGFSIDSRAVGEGEVFVAIRGERLDGHAFVRDALQRGAGAIVSSDGDWEVPGRTVIRVDDTLKALQEIASFRRRKFCGPVVGVVGSNGKTTTKELLSGIIGRERAVLKTTGNLNNHIGMPLCIARMGAEAEVMVLEMGTNRPGDVDLLCSIGHPDVGVITNIGYEHMEGFGSLEGVRESELEILPYIRTAVVNGDDEFLMQGIKGSGFSGEVITFGIKRDAAVMARNILNTESGTSFDLCWQGGRMTVQTGLHGSFNILNALAAAAASLHLGISPETIRQGLASCEAVGMRFEIRKEGGITFLNDVYNANPSSMILAVNELGRLMATGQYRRAVAVLGDMRELGDYAVSSHRNLGMALSDLAVRFFIGVGPLMAEAVKEFKGEGITAESAKEAGNRLGEIIEQGDVVLIKGSRGMRMEGVLEAWRERSGMKEEGHAL
ncbi:MAG: UDP-N-acetylmuramoyl-tripeptide--D-alanyl-D-alanine ligase [Nitrospirales bacterium]|nr:UDP-N-acetylmuramoyl-tripeptide--D-alanyl-D-alanine ligase [Nitrospirales bacterium]